MRTIASIAALQWAPDTTPKDREEGTQQFFGTILWLLVIIPIVLVVFLAAIKRRKSPGLPHVNSETWKALVDESRRPVVVHVYDSWSIGDRVIERQVALLAEKTRDQMDVYWLEIDKSPGLQDRYPTLEQRSVALFLGGRLMWQGIGVHGHEEILAEMREVL